MNAEETLIVLKNMPVEYSIMLRAKHGVGKSSVVRQATEEMGIGFFDVRLSQCEVGDIKGLPYLDQETKTTVFAKPYWWPRDPESKGILFFDELNRASKDVLQAVFEICLDKRLDGEPLPKGWRVVTAVNGEDEYDVVELDPALLDRWFVVDFDPSHKEWIAWASKTGVSEEVIEFVRENKNVLDPPIGNLEAGRVYPSRRSWVACDTTLKRLNLLGENVDPGMLVQITKGWVGRDVAIMFEKYVTKAFSRLKASDILDTFDKVSERFESACADIEVISTYAASIVAEIQRRIKPGSAKKFGKVQEKALREVFLMVPADVAAQMWMLMLKEAGIKKRILPWKDDAVMSKRIKEIYLKK